MNRRLTNTAGCWWGGSISKGPMSLSCGCHNSKGHQLEETGLRLERWERVDSEGPCMHAKELRFDPVDQCFSN